jgi:cytosine/adenosine deaminase-related metal-dependent hydrolase
LIRLHASWVVPISGPPLRDGWVEVDLDRITSCGSDDSPKRGRQRSEAARVVDLGGVAIMPGLVNAHTHLELSYLRGQIRSGSSFVAWIRDLMAARGQRSDPRSAEILDGVDLGIAEAVRCGTAVVGDISNTLVTFGPLAQSPLAAVVFYELIGFKTPHPVELVERAHQTIRGLSSTDRVRPSLAAHAPYSVAPRVFRAMRRTLDHEPFAPSSVHLAEAVEELEFIRSASGAWRTLLEELDAWDAAWVAPGMSPVEYLDACGFLGPHVLAIHGVQMTSSDLSRLKAHGSTLVTCPRSNQYTNAGKPPIGKFYEVGVRVAVGTDSLASTPDLNMFSELATMRSLAPSVPAARLLESATKQGATALSFDNDYGTIEPGKRARLLAVEVPARTDDVEEYLVSGIHPEQVRWIEL